MLIPNCNPNLVLLQSVMRDEDGQPVVDQFPIVGWIVGQSEESSRVNGVVEKALPIIFGELDSSVWAIHDKANDYSWLSDGSVFGQRHDPVPDELLALAQKR